MLLLGSCITPEPVIKLISLSENAQINGDKAVVTDSLDGIKYRLTFDKVANKNIYFNVSVINQSDQIFQFNPKDLFYATDGLFHDTTDLMPKTWACDADQKLYDCENILAQISTGDSLFFKYYNNWHFWKFDVMHSIGLNPGEYVEGKVLFPYNSEIETFFIYMPVDHRYLVFPFERFRYRRE